MDACAGVCGWDWSKPVSKVMFNAVFQSFSMFVDFLVCLVLAGRLSPSDSPLLLVTLVLVDMIVYKIKGYM